MMKLSELTLSWSSGQDIIQQLEECRQTSRVTVCDGSKFIWHLPRKAVCFDEIYTGVEYSNFIGGTRREARFQTATKQQQEMSLRFPNFSLGQSSRLALTAFYPIKCLNNHAQLCSASASVQVLERGQRFGKVA